MGRPTIPMVRATWTVEPTDGRCPVPERPVAGPTALRDAAWAVTPGGSARVHRAATSQARAEARTRSSVAAGTRGPHESQPPSSRCVGSRLPVGAAAPGTPRPVPPLGAAGPGHAPSATCCAARVSDLESAAARRPRAGRGVWRPLRDSLARVERQVGALERDRVEQYARLGQQLQHGRGLRRGAARADRRARSAPCGRPTARRHLGRGAAAPRRRARRHAGARRLHRAGRAPRRRTAARATGPASCSLPGRQARSSSTPRHRMTAFLDAQRHQDDDPRGGPRLLPAHAKALRGHVDDARRPGVLADRSRPRRRWWSASSRASVLAAALDADPGLHEDAHGQARGAGVPGDAAGAAADGGVHLAAGRRWPATPVSCSSVGARAVRAARHPGQHGRPSSAARCTAPSRTTTRWSAPWSAGCSCTARRMQRPAT